MHRLITLCYSDKRIYSPISLIWSGFIRSIEPTILFLYHQLCFMFLWKFLEIFWFYSHLIWTGGDFKPEIKLNSIEFHNSKIQYWKCISDLHVKHGDCEIMIEIWIWLWAYLWFRWKAHSLNKSWKQKVGNTLMNVKTTTINDTH